MMRPARSDLGRQRRQFPRVLSGSAAAVLVGVGALALASSPAEAAAVVSPPVASHPIPCTVFCPRTTQIQIAHPKNNYLIVYSTWTKAGTNVPASETFSVSCDDGFGLTKTVSTTGPDQGMVEIDRTPGDPGIEHCTVSQTMAPGWSTTASFSWLQYQGAAYGYDFVEFDS
jgi:hypothetical protein